MVHPPLSCPSLWVQFITTPLGNSLGSVNKLRTEAKNIIRQKHGVGIRHLQGYLDWILFRKQMRYRYEADLWADKAYEQAMREPVPFTCDASEIRRYQ